MSQPRATLNPQIVPHIPQDRLRSKPIVRKNSLVKKEVDKKKSKAQERKLEIEAARAAKVGRNAK